MNNAWIKKLAEINKRTGVEPGSPVPVKNILQAFKDAGVSEDEQAKILAGFMATVDVKPADAATPAEPAAAPATTLTMAEILQLIQDPTKHADLVAKWKKLSPEQQAELKAQIDALKPADAKKAAPSAGAAVQAISKYMNNWATAIKAETDKNKKIQLAKEVVNFLADRKDTPEAQSAVPAAIAILKRSNMGPIQAKLISSLKSGLTMEESMQLMERILLECDLTWSDLAVQVVINEHANQIEVYDIMYQIKQSLRLT